MVKREGWLTKSVCLLTAACFLTVTTGSVFAQDSTAVSPQSQPVIEPLPVEAPQDTVQPSSAAPAGKKANDFDEYLQGKMDGKRASKGHAAWILAGLAGTGLCLLIGCAGVGLALIVAPSPPETALMGKSQAYINGFTEAYKSKSRIKNTGWAVVGLIFAALINVTVNLAMGNDFSDY
ncbi:MAG: hypothetical protein JW699_06905 [Chitinispirillaceae bacterium]|nr:hypothetical protein [Chitinispirillaceae bacterium]